MAEYWKSLPRKFCEVCKCWFADNKASIDFHERGKRHQENAQKQIKDIRKRSIKEYKKEKELENEMEKIEKAALAAYKKDLQNMQVVDTSQIDLPTTNKVPSSTAEVSTKPKKSFKNVPKKEVTVKIEKVPPAVEPVLEKLWYEAETDEGYKYYWNNQTSESRWEPPEEGYVTIEEQNQSSFNTITKESQEKSPEESISIKEEISDEELSDPCGIKTPEESTSLVKEESKEDIPCGIGPQPKHDPYGQWITVQKKEPVKYDLQLPKPSEDYIEVVIPLHKDGPSLKFKEKVVGQISDGDPTEVTFKKRKLAGSFKRNARQRTMDDD